MRRAARRPPAIRQPPCSRCHQRGQRALGIGEERRRVAARREALAREDVERELARRLQRPRSRARGAPSHSARLRPDGRRPTQRASRAASRSSGGTAAPSSICVSSRSNGPSGGRKRVIRPGEGAKPRAGSSALIRTSIAWPPREARPVADSRLACGNAELLTHEVEAGHELRDGVLDLEPRIQLDEVEGAVGPDEELERPRVPVADRSAGTLGGRLHLLPLLGRERG